jgi:hypothetical protein
MVALLAETAMFGNAHPLVVALLAWTILRPSAGVWVGVAASMKLAPILFVAGWLADGRWRQGAIAVVTTALLFAPMLAFDLSNYVTSPGTGLLSVYAASPALWAVLAIGSLGIVGWLAVRRSPVVFAAAGIAMFLVPPRVSTAYLAFVLPGLIATVAAMTKQAAVAPSPVNGTRVADAQRV